MTTLIIEWPDPSDFDAWLYDRLPAFFPHEIDQKCRNVHRSRGGIVIDNKPVPERDVGVTFMVLMDGTVHPHPAVFSGVDVIEMRGVQPRFDPTDLSEARFNAIADQKAREVKKLLEGEPLVLMRWASVLRERLGREETLFVMKELFEVDMCAILDALEK
jgi:hypothetical protein